MCTCGYRHKAINTNELYQREGNPLKKKTNKKVLHFTAIILIIAAVIILPIQVFANYKVRTQTPMNYSNIYRSFRSITSIRHPITGRLISRLPKKYHQNLNYTETTLQINNPDQGFYTPVYVKVNENGITYKRNLINDSTQLYHLRIDISTFSKANNQSEDKALTNLALSELEKLLKVFYDQDKNVIIRFAYDPGFSGARNKEPEIEMIVKHIKQLSPILNQYPDTITGIDVGLIGPWGEMHSSTLANKSAINTLIDTYLENTTDIPVFVRSPKMIYDYLDITVNDLNSAKIRKDSRAYRLGLFNDGYLGSENDLGTYTNRAKEIEWLSKQTTNHLPYGGEVAGPDSSLHNIDCCLDEMNQMNLSYLNNSWNTTVITKWRNSIYTKKIGTEKLYYGKNAYAYIENHLGYRFVLKDSVFTYGDDLSLLKIDLSIDNIGFGNLNKTKKMTLLFTDESGQVIPVPAGEYTGQSSQTICTPLNLASGTYHVYLRIDNGEEKYPVRFANYLWDSDLKANLIGTCRKK